MPDLCLGTIVGAITTLILCGPALFSLGYHKGMRQATREVHGRVRGTWLDHYRAIELNDTPPDIKNPKE